MSADRFVDSIAVNTHLNYTDGAYAKLKNVRDDLVWLGVRHVRDATPGGSAPISSYAYLADSGIKFDFVVRDEVAHALAQIKVAEAASRGSVEAVEGFNEINNWPIAYDGLKGDAAGLAAQQAIYAFVHGNASLATIPVYDLTGYEVLPVTTRAGSADYANQHVYPQNGEQPGYTANGDAWIERGIKGVEKFGLPVVITEFGYFSLPQSGWYLIGVDEESQAKGILNGLFDSAISGVSRMYLYELLDEKADPRGGNAGMHYGLFAFDNRAKPAATALHNLISILKANGNSASNRIERDGWRYTLSDLPPSGRHVLLRKADGTFEIALWNEVAFWDRASGKPMNSPPATVLVDLGSKAACINLYDPMLGPAPIEIQRNVQQIRVDVPDHPVLLEVAFPN
ncbi:calcium-binding protein [Paraburkholderia phenazinium]|nr:calcium-binding protein [Paraburkholderia phenazinium]